MICLRWMVHTNANANANAILLFIALKLILSSTHLVIPSNSYSHTPAGLKKMKVEKSDATQKEIKGF